MMDLNKQKKKELIKIIEDKDKKIKNLKKTIKNIKVENIELFTSLKKERELNQVIDKETQDKIDFLTRIGNRTGKDCYFKKAEDIKKDYFG